MDYREQFDFWLNDDYFDENKIHDYQKKKLLNKLNEFSEIYQDYNEDEKDMNNKKNILIVLGIISSVTFSYL